MSDLTWVEEPPAKKKTGRRGKWERIFAALRDRPGNWALVSDAGTANSARTIAYNVSNQVGFEGRPADVPNTEGRYDIYARYTGEANSD